MPAFEGGTGVTVVAGTISGDQGVPNSIANSWPFKITDGVGTVLGTAANPLRIDPTGDTTQPISAASLPLPTGAATQATLATLATDATVQARLGTLGQKAMAASTPVVVASDQSALPVTAAQLPVSLDQKDNAGSLSVVLSSEQGTQDRPLIARPPREFYDSFGRSRVAAPYTIWDSKLIADNAPLFWDDQETSGSGTSSTYNTNQASVTLAVSNLTAGTRVRQTFVRHAYQPGKGLLTLMTGILGTPATGITRRIGLFDANNGHFFESSPTTVRIGIRTYTSGSPVTTYVDQADWNIDKLDGTGPSGYTVDWSKVQIFGSSMEWLGVGSVWFFVVINGDITLVHRFDHANVITTAYMSTPNLPLRYEISNSGTGGAASLLQICNTVVVEGGRETTGLVRGISRGNTPLVTLNSAALFPLMAFRLRTGYLGADIKLLGLSIACSSTATYNWYIILNPTVVGTAFSWTAISGSSIEADVATTNATTVTGGTILAAGTRINDNEASEIAIPATDYRIGSNIAGTSDVVVVTVQRVVGGAETFYGSAILRDTF